MRPLRVRLLQHVSSPPDSQSRVDRIQAAPCNGHNVCSSAKFAYGEPAPSETATEEPSHDAPDETTRAYASATPSVTAPTAVVFTPAPHVSRDAAKRPAQRSVESPLRAHVRKRITALRKHLSLQATERLFVRVLAISNRTPTAKPPQSTALWRYLMACRILLRP